MNRTELVKTEDEDWLIDLESKDFGLDESERLAVHFDKTLSSLYSSSCQNIGASGWRGWFARTLQ